MPPAAVKRPPAPDALQLLFHLLDPPGNPAPVGLQLRFSRSPGTNTATQPGHLRATAGQPGKQVIQLSQFDLEPAFSRSRAGGKDVQNQLRPVDYLRIDRPL